MRIASVIVVIASCELAPDIDKARLATRPRMNTVISGERAATVAVRVRQTPTFEAVSQHRTRLAPERRHAITNIDNSRRAIVNGPIVTLYKAKILRITRGRYQFYVIRRKLLLWQSFQKSNRGLIR